MTNHPNASVASIAGAVSVIAVWAASLFGLDVPAYVASAFTTVLVGALLFVGNRW